MPATPIAWSAQTPHLQTKINSSSLGPLKQCPRRYEYEIVRGLRPAGEPESVDLRFGTLVHEGLELYESARAIGNDHEEALRAVLYHTERVTWDFKLGRSSFAGDLEKNRTTLLRVLCDYLDHWEGVEGYETLRAADGSPMVELKFEFDSGVAGPSGEALTFVGKLDKIVRVEALRGTFVLDTKTTKLALGNIYVSQYSPHNQFSLYAAAAKICFAEDVGGVLLDAISVKGGNIEFDRLRVPRDEEVLEDWLSDARYWLEQLVDFARRGHWPQNDTACGLFRGCPWRGVCGARPKERDFMLRTLAEPREGRANA